MTDKRSDRNVATTMARALELTEEALGEVARIAIEEIHSGLESSNHVEAAERDMRSALRQLVLAERELRSRPAHGSSFDGRRERIRPQAGSDSTPADA
jgi:3-oxoacyl-(acyl-carrier-protein) synthase